MMLYDLYWYLSNLPRWHIFAVFIVGYLVYYFIEVVKVSLLAAFFFIFLFLKDFRMLFMQIFYCIVYLECSVKEEYEYFLCAFKKREKLYLIDYIILS